MSIFKDQFPRIGASGQSTGYTIDQSIRFNATDTPKLTRTPSSTGNRDKWTFSAWVKRGKITDPSGGGGESQVLFTAGNDVNNFTRLAFQTTGGLNTNEVADCFHFIVQEGGTNTYPAIISTNRLFRDVSAWYHVVAVYDSGNSISSERIKIYFNGVRETNFSNTTYPSQNVDSRVNHASTVNRVGTFDLGNNKGHFDGYMAEIHLLDGYAYGPEYFGEFKEDTDIWIPKKYTESYGTNGFKIDGRDSGDLGDDESGQGNDFSTSGLAAHDQMIDTPTNNFCVMNPIYADNSATNSLTSSEGNLKLAGTSSGFDFLSTTFNLPKSGKWYYEYTIGGGYDGFGFFIQGEGGTAGGANGLGQLSASQGGGIQYRGWRNGGSYTTTFADYASGVFSSGEIHQVAIDVDNNDLYYGIANVYQAADAGKDGNPSSGSNPLLADFAFSTNDIVLAHMVATDSNPEHFNFGQNGTFNGTKTAQGNSDANGIGNFYYAVPTGFLALCSSNLGAV